MIWSSLLTLGLLLCLNILPAFSEPEINSGTIRKDALLDQVLKCPIKSTDPELSLCITKLVKSLGSSITGGIPELGIKSIDPFHLDTFTYSINLWPIVPKIMFNNIIIRHLSKFELGSIVIDKKTKSLKLEVGAPVVTTEAEYKTDGNYPFLRLIGAGPVSFKAIGGKAVGELKFRIETEPKSGKKVLQLDELKVDVGQDNIKTQIDGIFSKIPTWNRFGPLINRLANDYNKELFEIIKPELIQGMVIPLVSKMVNNFLIQMPELVSYFEN